MEPARPTAPGESGLRFLDFSGGHKPGLLDTMDNHLGARTTVQYRPSTEFFLCDDRDPATRWRTTLPFPVHVVARVEVVDEISAGTSTTEYRYHHGYWDGVEREFRGFAMVEQFDTETFRDPDADSGDPLLAADTHQDVVPSRTGRRAGGGRLDRARPVPRVLERRQPDARPAGRDDRVPRRAAAPCAP